MACKPTRIVAAVLVFGVPIFSLPAHAAIRHVPNEFPTIQAAINTCQLGDEVVVADGIYTGNGNRDIVLSKYPITIRSENGPQRCIIDCQGSASEQHRGFNLNKINLYYPQISAATLYRIKGFTIRGGYTNMGGGILCQDSYFLEISDCVIAGNFANDGGGIYISTSLDNPPHEIDLIPTVIINCVIANNRAMRGGGVFCDTKTANDVALPAVKDCLIKYNLADNGGGVYCGGGTFRGILSKTPQIIRCAIINNSVRMDGGGISFWMCNSALDKCTIINNNTIGGGNGGGIACRDSNTVISGCALTDNSIQHGGRGGGIASQNSKITVKGSIIKNNVVNGGMDGAGISSWDSDVCIANCSVTGNRTDSGRGAAIYSRNRTITLVDSLIAQNASQNVSSIFLENVLSGTVRNCTIVSNKYRDTIYSTGLWSANSSVSVKNSILWDNGNGKQLSGSGLIMPSAVYSDIQHNWPGEGNIDSAPKFIDMGFFMVNSTVNFEWPDVWIGGDYRLAADSPCINAGDPIYAAEPNEKDLDGRPRVIGGRIDMGAYEFNHVPTADAGSDQTVYAWINGFAQVKLDGSASTDVDGGNVTYKWIIDGNQVAAGVCPTISLPTGQHVAKLIVNDGVEDSKPGEVLITVVAAIECEMKVIPAAVNLQSQGGRIIVAITLPQGILGSQIDDKPLILTPGNVVSTSKYVTTQKANGQDIAAIIAIFDRKEVIDAGSADGQLQVKVAGKLKSGQCFYGADTIRIVGK